MTHLILCVFLPSEVRPGVEIRVRLSPRQERRLPLTSCFIFHLLISSCAGNRVEGVSVRRPGGRGMRSPRRWLAWELWRYVGKFTVRVIFLCANGNNAKVHLYCSS